MQQFTCKTKVIYGQDALSALSREKGARALLVTDRFFAENGTAQAVCARLGGQTKIFSEVTPDPSAALAARGAALVREYAPDTVLALGGGSVLDCAKAMVFFAERPSRLIAIPTTSGTGAEVTSFAILTHGGVKHPLVDEKLRPAVAILDDTLLTKLPKPLIADAGFDVLSHCLEAIAAKNASAITDALAQRAFNTVLQQLPRSFAGDASVRGGIHLAATMAGMAFDSAGLGVCHALAHALGGLYHLPHGRLNAILLPQVVEYNAQVCEGAYCALAEACNLGAPTQRLTLKNLIFALRRLRRELCLPATLTEAGLKNIDAAAVADAALQDACLQTNPILPKKEALEALVTAVT